MRAITRPTWPEPFVWTKMGWESGLRLLDILQQKEVERQAQSGLFLWGIGTPVSLERLQALRDRVEVPHVVFVKMVSGPRLHDYEPDSVTAWRAYVDENGQVGPLQALGAQYCEISRGGKVRPSYALVCRRDAPITLARIDLRLGEYRNFCSTSKSERLGGSQTTLLVERYRVVETPAVREGFTAALVWPFLVRLADPIVVPVGTVGLRLQNCEVKG